jgi:hypothetical protein
MQNVCDEREISDRERELCEFYLHTIASVRRFELRALYAIASRLHKHRAPESGTLRESLKRIGRVIRKDRTTLMRYSFVYQRIKPDEFECLISLSDPKGLPATFWDLIEVAELSKENRARDLSQRLRLRDGSSRGFRDDLGDATGVDVARCQKVGVGRQAERVAPMRGRV